MVGESAFITRLSRLLADGTLEAEALHARHHEIRELLARSQRGGPMTRAELLVLGVNLHAYYTALETLLERIARHVDGDIPSGPSWHRDLVLQMRLELPGVRPAVIPSTALIDLDELRKFRHFFRNAYVLDLDPVRTIEHAQRVENTHPPVAAGIATLFQHVEAVIQSLARQ